MRCWKAALRLAWYKNAYGDIPDVEKTKLAIAGHGLQRRADTDALLAKARLIKNYLLEISAD
jgi:hypothetical protein